MKKDFIKFPDFLKLDLRVGQIIKVEKLEKSRNLLEMLVDFGPEYGQVTIMAGIADYYKPQQLLNNKYPFIANLEPKPMMGKTSNGMMLVVEYKEKPYIIKLNKKFDNGSILR